MYQSEESKKKTMKIFTDCVPNPKAKSGPIQKGDQVEYYGILWCTRVKKVRELGKFPLTVSQIPKQNRDQCKNENKLNIMVYCGVPE